jgi:hypothetical protein
MSIPTLDARTTDMSLSGSASRTPRATRWPCGPCPSNTPHNITSFSPPEPCHKRQLHHHEPARTRIDRVGGRKEQREIRWLTSQTSMASWLLPSYPAPPAAVTIVSPFATQFPIDHTSSSPPPMPRTPGKLTARRPELDRRLLGVAGGAGLKRAKFGRGPRRRKRRRLGC